MHSEVAAEAGRLLERYYAGLDEPLDGMLAGVLPAVRAVLTGKGMAGDDLEDACANCRMRVLEALARSRQNNASPITDIAAYTMRIARNIFNDYMRARRPRWYCLKDRIVYVLDGHSPDRSMAKWRIQADWIGGFTRWRGTPVRATRRYRDFCSDHRTFERGALGGEDPSTLPLHDLLARLFRWIDTPEEVDALTGHIATLHRLEEAEALSLEAMEESNWLSLSRIPSTELEAGIIATISSEELCTRYWREICNLPERQRAALLLGMSGDELLLLSGTVSEAAAALALTMTSLNEIWSALPLTDRAIAERLGVSEEQVSSLLRKCARARLARRRAKWDSDAER